MHSTTPKQQTPVDWGTSAPGVNGASNVWADAPPEPWGPSSNERPKSETKKGTMEKRLGIGIEPRWRYLNNHDPCG